MLLANSKCYILLFSLLTLPYFDLVAGRSDFLFKGRTTPVRNSAFTRTSTTSASFFIASRDIQQPFWNSSRRFCSESFKKEARPPQKHGLLVKGTMLAVGFVGGGTAAYWWAQKNHFKARAKKY